MTKTLTNPKVWAQLVKQFLVLISGIETKSQEDMDKGGRENFIMSVRLMCKYMLIYGALRPPVHLCRSNDSKMEIIARFNYE